MALRYWVSGIYASFLKETHMHLSSKYHREKHQNSTYAVIIFLAFKKKNPSQILQSKKVYAHNLTNMIYFKRIASKTVKKKYSYEIVTNNIFESVP